MSMGYQLQRLRSVTSQCREDMHEPDNNAVYAEVQGSHLDNAMPPHPDSNCDEFIVGITAHCETEWFNLATLIALARKAQL